MAPEKRGPSADSLAANLRAALALDQLFSTKSIRHRAGRVFGPIVIAQRMFSVQLTGKIS